MVDEKLLKLIQCPISGQRLEIAGEAVVQDLNEKIATRSVRDASDELVESALDQGLITIDGALVYPVRGGIPTLTADAAISLTS